jgi:hypothetical protein
MARGMTLALAYSCPWCSIQKVWLWDKAVPGKVAVCCSNPNCAATGPLANDEDEAVRLWNRCPRRGYAARDHQRLAKVLAEAGRGES